MVIFENIEQAFPEADEIYVYREGQVIRCAQGGDEYDRIMAVWQSTLEECRQMPAFGVSLNDMTVKAMQKGVWIEFRYSGVCECQGMGFERLAVNVVGSFKGFNIVRYCDGLYEGRCYYVDLVRGDMSEVYDCLIRI